MLGQRESGVIAMEILRQKFEAQSIIGASDAMMSVFRQVERVANTDATVLIRGESGTGKELVAEAIHRCSRRCQGPFMAINVAAVPETLVESELFGHVDGAFTGADKRRLGRFEAAQGGTLFIDEIGDLKLTSQAKLLRVMESRKISPVGSNELRDVDVRLVFATNRDLEQMVAGGNFREDLYYRINVVTVDLPPLRRRQDDIALLVEHLLDEFCQANGKPRLSLDEGLRQFLVTHYWPGNVRQLRNCIESMVVMAEGPILTVGSLPVGVRNQGPESAVDFEIPPDLTLEDIEKATVLERLDRFNGNRTQAAESLGISVRTLQRRLKRWDADREAVS